MDKNHSSKINNIALLKILSNLDTQNAIVAAIAISFITLLFTIFGNLCNYVYWSAYFSKFNIPLAYIDEAIIHETGIKYLLIMIIPLLAFFWWLLKITTDFFNKFIRKITFSSKNKKLFNVMNKLFSIFITIIAFTSIPLLIDVIIDISFFINNPIIIILYSELIIFLLWKTCKETLGQKFSFSQKTYNTVRIICVFLSIYIILGIMFFMGGFENYTTKGSQSLQVISDSEVNYFTISNDEEIEVQVVLFETSDYYYVADAVITNADIMKVTIYGKDSYRFIDKVNCPVMSVYAQFNYIGSDNNTLLTFNYLAIFIIISLYLIIVFICLLSIPKKKKSSANEDINNNFPENITV